MPQPQVFHQPMQPQMMMHPAMQPGHHPGMVMQPQMFPQPQHIQMGQQTRPPLLLKNTIDREFDEFQQQDKVRNPEEFRTNKIHEKRAKHLEALDAKWADEQESESENSEQLRQRVKAKRLERKAKKQEIERRDKVQKATNCRIFVFGVLILVPITL